MIRNITHRILVILIASVLLSSAGKADCGLTMSANDINIAWDLNFTHVAVSVQVTRSTSDACTFTLGFTKGGAASYSDRRGADSGNYLRYQVYQDSGLTKVLKDGVDVLSADEVVQGGFAAGATPTVQTLNFYFEVPYSLATTPTLAARGTYTDTFTVNLYDGTALPLGAVLTSEAIAVSVTVSPMIALSLVDTGGSFVLGQTTRNADFITLNQGATKAMDLRLRTNAGFSVSFSSTGNGKLKHIDPLKPSEVPYTFFANGGILDLSNSNSVPVVGLSGGGSTVLGGLAYPLKVVVGSLSGPGVLAGSHSDAITITATTTE